jgi:hypothetical protein
MTRTTLFVLTVVSGSAHADVVLKKASLELHSIGIGSKGVVKFSTRDKAKGFELAAKISASSGSHVSTWRNPLTGTFTMTFRDVKNRSGLEIVKRDVDHARREISGAGHQKVAADAEGD